MPEVWRCELCRCFHLRAGPVLMVFTPREFEVFMQDVVECYCVQTQADELGDSNTSAARKLNLVGGSGSLPHT